MIKTRRIPWWVWVVAIALACSEPLGHVWIAMFPPEGVVPTGLRTGDSHVYLHSMRMFQTGFYSPYATCKAPRGPNYFGYFATPVHLLYGLLGATATALGIKHFLALGLFNGLSAAFYLVAAYCFVRQLVPRVANLAFLLFALGGGPGGLLYLAAGALGLYTAPDFEAYFRRFAEYELIEGPYMWPILHLPRLYYTLSLGLSLAAFTLFARALGSRRTTTLVGSCVLFFLGQLINARCGSLVWVVAMLYLVIQKQMALIERVRFGAILTSPAALGGLFTASLLRFHPTYSANQLALVRETMWLSPFVCAALPYFLVAPREVFRALPRLNRQARVAACACVGYLAMFALLYLCYQVYWGNVLRCHDTVVAIAVSDWALTGAAVGAVYGVLGWPGKGHSRKGNAVSSTVANAGPESPHNSAPSRGYCDLEDTQWVVLWLLFFLTVAISAWGHGSFMRLVPRRLMVLLGLPICILSAQGLHRMRSTSPRGRRVLIGIILVFGMTSAMVSALFFQGPLARQPGRGPFAYLHYEAMTSADEHLLKRLGPGRVLAPVFNPFSFTEVIALRPHNSVAFGVGTLNHSDQLFVPMRKKVDTFFSASASNDFRKAFVEEWRVDYVYCPDTCPVEPEIIEQLRRSPWLSESAREGRGALFSVRDAPNG